MTEVWSVRGDGEDILLLFFTSVGYKELFSYS